ncbi:14250_t:CDS:2, partial [Cetraspora pellucida]
QELRMVDSAVSKIQQLMTKIKASVRLCDELRTLYKFKEIRYLKAELDMKVRWNSTFYMLQKFKNMELALNLFSIDNNSIAELYPNNDDQQKLQIKRFSQNNVATSMNKKLVEYWEIMDSSSIVSAVFDPHTRLKIFNDITEQENTINLTHQAFNLYKFQLKPSVLCNNMNSNEPKLYTPRQFFWQLGS